VGNDLMKLNLWQIIGSGARVLLMTYVPNVEFGFYYYYYAQKEGLMIVNVL
jgi:hypothetical protein